MSQEYSVVIRVRDKDDEGAGYHRVRDTATRHTGTDLVADTFSFTVTVTDTN